MSTTSTVMPVTTCPKCGRKTDRALHTQGKETPTSGDLSICFECGTLAEFDENLTLMPIDDGKLLHIMLSDGWPAIELLQKGIRINQELLRINHPSECQLDHGECNNP